MSAFLGPVHHWMYSKIKLQEVLTDQLLQLAQESGWESGLADRLEQVFGKVETAPLETIIDTANIHGWLANRVGCAEARFAKAVQSLLETDRGRLDRMCERVRSLGAAHALKADVQIEDAYQAIDGLLLDGMPCDGGRRVNAEDADEIIWEYDPAVHTLCRDAQGLAVFAALREAFLAGVLAGSGLKLEQLGETIYRLGRGA